MRKPKVIKTKFGSYRYTGFQFKWWSINFTCEYRRWGLGVSIDTGGAGIDFLIFSVFVCWER